MKEQKQIDDIFLLEQIKELKKENLDLKRKLEESKIEQSKDNSLNIIEEAFAAMPVGFVLLDPELNVMKVNSYAEKMLSPHILNQYHLNCLEQFQRSQSNHTFPTLLTYRDKIAAEFTYKAPENPANINWVSVRSFPILNEKNELTAIVEIFSDVSSKLEIYEQSEKISQLFEQLVLNTKIGMYRTTLSGKILMVNPALAKILNYDSTEDLQFEDANEVGYYESDKRADFISQLRQKGELAHYNSIWRTRNGKPIFILETARLVYDSEQNVKYIEGTVQEVTELKLIEKSLRQRTNALEQKVTFFEAVLNKIPNCIQVFDAQKHVIHKNATASKYINPKNLSSALFRTFQTKSYSFSRELNEDLNLWFEIYTYPILDELNAIIYVVEHRREITTDVKTLDELNQYKDQLEKLIKQRTKALEMANANLASEIQQKRILHEKYETSKEMLELVINNIPQYILWKDRNSRYLGCNNNFAKRAGLKSSEDIIGKTDLELNWDKNDAEFYMLRDNQVMTSGKAELHTIIKEKNEKGKDVFFDFNWIPLKNTHNEVVGILETYEDITRRKKAEELSLESKIMAEQANRLKSQFIFNVSHEIRTPLNSIMGFSELILTKNEEPKTKEYAEVVLSQSELLLRLINQILDFAKIDSGKVTLFSEPINLRKIVKTVIDSQQSFIEKKNIEIKTDIDQDIDNIYLGDELRVHEVLINLLGNAVKFTDSGTIEVAIKKLSTTETSQLLRFEISDTGIGISEEKLEKIFESFTQADGNITRKFGGTGLGTTISKQLVELMDGNIGVYNRKEQGSVFWFEIPFLICTKTEITSNNEQEQRASQINIPEASKILIVEDYAPNREMIKQHLLDFPLDVDFAENGEIAINMCKVKEYDLIFMDVQMPVMDGYHATIFIREEENLNQTKPIIGLTAHADSLTRQKSFEAGMNDLIVKPVRRKTVLATISKWITLNYEENSTEEFFNNSELPIALDEVLPEFNYSLEVVILIAKQFIANIEDQLGHIDRALQEQDYEFIRNEVHKIKGGALNLTANPLGNIASKIESSIIEQNFDIKMLEILNNEFERFKNKIDEISKNENYSNENK